MFAGVLEGFCVFSCPAPGMFLIPVKFCSCVWGSRLRFPFLVY